MIVVADSSPLNILVRIECVHVLPELFKVVVIPAEVRAELSERRTPEAVKRFIEAPPGWMRVLSPTQIESIPPLDRGEEAAISLARELSADALLIDEKDGRKAATARGIAVIGTLGVLEAAAERKVIDLPQTLHRLLASDFRMSPALVEAVLARHKQRERG